MWLEVTSKDMQAFLCCREAMGLAPGPPHYTHPGLAPSSLKYRRMGWWVAWGKGEQTSSAQIPKYALGSQAK